MRRSTTTGMAAGVLALVAAFLLAASGAAQSTANDAAALQQAQQVLRERNRETMNPAKDPLVVVGLEQGGNDLRSRTPALLKSDKAATLLDPEQAHRRALAMYEDRATFHRPPPASTPARATSKSSASKPTPSRPVEAGLDGQRMSRWATALPSVGLGVLVVLWRFQRTKRNLRWRTAGKPARSPGAPSA